MPHLDALIAANERRWARARLTRDFSRAARRLVSPAAKTRYQTVARQTGVPWWFIAVVHERECSQDWLGSLAQGDRWDRMSVHVPAGRGPFGSWEDAAVDALVNCAPHAARNRDWHAGALLTLLERYNGLGYARRGLPSPYLWAGTDQYVAGKYVRDNVFDPSAIDRQLGCAGLLKAMMALDPDITVAHGPVERIPAEPAASSPSPHVTRRLFMLMSSLLAALFKRSTS